MNSNTPDKFKPMPHQVKWASFATSEWAAGRVTCDRSDCGTGKTLTAAMAIAESRRPCLIVCPLAVVESWRQALAMVGVEALGIIGWEKMRAMNTPFYVNEVTPEPWRVPAGTVIVFDEVHNAAGRTSLNSRMVINSAKQKISTHLISATILNRQLLPNCFAIGYALKLHNLWDFDKFLQKYRYYTDVEWTTLIDSISWHVALTDVRKNLPIECTTSIPAKCDARSFERQVNFRQMQETYATKPFSKFVRNSQKEELLLLSQALAIAQKGVKAGFSMVIFVKYRETADLLRHELSCDVIDGRVKDKQAFVDRFQRGESQILVLQYQAGGVGISLQDMVGNQPRCTVLFPPPGWIRLQQALGRVFRLTSQSPVHQTILLKLPKVPNRAWSMFGRPQRSASLF